MKGWRRNEGAERERAGARRAAGSARAGGGSVPGVASGNALRSRPSAPPPAATWPASAAPPPPPARSPAAARCAPPGAHAAGDTAPAAGTAAAPCIATRGVRREAGRGSAGATAAARPILLPFCFRVLARYTGGGRAGEIAAVRCAAGAGAAVLCGARAYVRGEGGRRSGPRPLRASCAAAQRSAKGHRAGCAHSRPPARASGGIQGVTPLVSAAARAPAVEGSYLRKQGSTSYACAEEDRKGGARRVQWVALAAAAAGGEFNYLGEEEWCASLLLGGSRCAASINGMGGCVQGGAPAAGLGGPGAPPWCWANLPYFSVRPFPKAA